MQSLFIQKLSGLPLLLKIILLGLVYWLFCKIGTLTFYQDYGVAIYWPATGIAILGIFILGSAASAGIFIVAFIANYFIYRQGIISPISQILTPLAIAAGNMAGALFGSYFLRNKVLLKDRSFFQLSSMLSFFLLVVLIPSLITSIIGGTVTWYAGAYSDFFTKTHSWFLSDLIGVLVILPPFIAWMEKPELSINKKKIPEFAIIVFLLILSGYFIFTDFFDNYFYNFLIAYFTTPLYVWLALRFDSKALTAVQIIALVSISSLAINAGNNYLGDIVEKPYVLLQGFTILITVLALIVHSIFMERQQSILSLNHREQDLRNVLINLPLGVGILNKDVKPEFLNKEFILKTGLNISDFLPGDNPVKSGTSGLTTSELLQNAWKSTVEDINLQVAKEKDISIIAKDNTRKDFSLNISPLEDRYLLVMSDISQRKQLLERIRDNERKLSSLVQNLQGMVFQCRLDRNRTMEFASEGSFKLTGYLPSELIYNSQVSYASIIHERFHEYVLNSIESSVKKGQPYSLQYQILTKEDTFRWVVENGNGIFSTDGICRSVEGFIYDITDRVEALESLQNEEERYRSLFENMPVSLWEDDYSDVKEFIDSWPEEQKKDIPGTLRNNSSLADELFKRIKVLDTNRASLELYSEDVKTDLIENMAEVFASGDLPAFYEVLASFYHGSSSSAERIMEVSIKKVVHFLSVRWFLMPGCEKDLSRVLVAITDITGLKNAEKEIQSLNEQLERKVMKRTEELDRTNQELEAFSYSVSHDLKAPLRAVRGFSILLGEEFGKQLPVEASHYIRNIQNNTDKMTRLITDLLRFSRLGRKSLSYSEVDTNKMVQTAWDELCILQKPENIIFAMNPLPKVMADEALLMQVFANLFSNAVKFSKPGIQGTIEVSCKTGKDFHEFCVCDQGIGFEQKFSEKIFKVFQRLNAEDEYEGNGVGLSLAQRIIHRHGGIIRAESEPGSGTKIFFTIPVEIDS